MIRLENSPLWFDVLPSGPMGETDSMRSITRNWLLWSRRPRSPRFAGSKLETEGSRWCGSSPSPSEKAERANAL